MLKPPKVYGLSSSISVLDSLMIYTSSPGCALKTLPDSFIDISPISSDIFSLEYSNKDTNLFP